MHKTLITCSVHCFLQYDSSWTCLRWVITCYKQDIDKICLRYEACIYAILGYTSLLSICYMRIPYRRNVQVTLHYLKIMEPRPIVFKEWRDTRTFSNLKSTHCTLLIWLIINLVRQKKRTITLHSLKIMESFDNRFTSQMDFNKYQVLFLLARRKITLIVPLHIYVYILNSRRKSSVFVWIIYK